MGRHMILAVSIGLVSLQTVTATTWNVGNKVRCQLPPSFEDPRWHLGVLKKSEGDYFEITYANTATQDRVTKHLKNGTHYQVHKGNIKTIDLREPSCKVQWPNSGGVLSRYNATMLFPDHDAEYNCGFGHAVVRFDDPLFPEASKTLAVPLSWVSDVESVQPA